ncbi:hypothetical protein [Mycolicibacter kumamotonensis]|uniref:Uncharacterized protein n=1 Tax=Mycolicibacter kumamotonensis TaxID=354243 RepID=A0A7K3LE38_9MYCO|nr:hypothetical protein [Mycolicibacter kumamotonensis]NDJ90582.1 hypothetical protein [Mycolicibacter kumamotonensis]
MTNIDPTDYLKFCAAEAKSQLDYVRDRLGQADAAHPLTEDETEVLQTILEGVQRTVIESTAVFCRDGNDFDTYSDGRPVWSQLETEQGVVFEYRWHPQLDHRRNKAHEIYTAKGRDGRRRTVFVSAPGVLDCVAAGPDLKAVK